MVFRFRRSVRIAPGIRINLSKSGLSYSFGGRGATVNVGLKGTKATYGIPGTGLTYSEQLAPAKKRRKASSPVEPAPPLPAADPSAGRRFSLPRAIGVAVALILAVVIIRQPDGGPTASAPAPALGSSQPVVWTAAPASSPPSAAAPILDPPSAAHVAVPAPSPASLRLPAPAPEAAPSAPETLYVSGREVALRDAANQKGQILDRFGPGQAVTTLERRPGWVRVRHGLTQREGWIQAKRLRDAPPVEETERPPAPKAAPALSVAAVAKLLIAESIASYPGSCACPYQTDRGGRSCGRRSAHSRPGGYSPLCYPADNTPAMVASYRANH
jgi:Protein of unknown function (DUF4236)/Bacterial SH3 domain